VIYASPIRALSNQKYCEFKKKFKDVGIITGDVNINPNAQCLIITTEILHKFLYNQSETLNNVGTVIFDEVHYINDNERGHIWEEILIILPNYISIIMLSATIPNYYEFACWVGKIKNTIVYVEITKNRVVPLEYFIYIDKDNTFKVKDKDDTINYAEIENAFNYLKKIKAPKNNTNKKLNLNSENNNFNNEEKKKYGY
jgi:antiviral helicase SKI2